VLFQGTLVATQVLVPLLAGLALTALFVAHAQRSDHPLLELCLFANRAFAAAAATTFDLGARASARSSSSRSTTRAARGGRHRHGPAADRRLVRHGDPHGGPDDAARGRRVAQAGADAFMRTFLIAAVVTMLGVVPAVVLARVERRARAGRLAAARAGTEADRAAAAGKGALA
jgi:hypothetical protein